MDINILNLFLKSGKAKIKSSISVKKSIRVNYISYREP